MEEGVTRGRGHPLGGHPVPLDYAAPPRGRVAQRDWRFPLTWSALLLAGVLLFAGGLAVLLAGVDRRTDSYLLAGAVVTALTLFCVVRARADK
jgi:hypothetical protein